MKILHDLRLCAGEKQVLLVPDAGSHGQPIPPQLAYNGSLVCAVSVQALPLLLAALYDLRSQSDLALRQAAASALAGLVEALAEAEAATAGATGEDPPDSILRLIGRVLYPQVSA